MLTKPDDVFDRDSEWEDLVDFATSDLPGLRIAVVYGRRRQGKSYLLRRLAEACGGLYHLATEQTEAVSLRRFADSLATWLGMPSGALAFGDWEASLTTTAQLMTDRAKTSTAPHPPLLILDEFPYLAHESPGLPSIIQGLYDAIGPGSARSRTPVRLVLCGSAMSVMSGLLSGTKALRGRGALELRVKPFGYRDTRAFWRIEAPRTAFVHHAFVGGTPGYRELVPQPVVPKRPHDIGTWVVRNILRPSVPLFDEANRLVHEDPRIRDTAVYGSVMAVIAAGESSPAKIGGLLGRQSSSLTYQLGMLESAGFIERRQNLLVDRRPTITVADPIVRLHHLVIEPHLADLEAGRGGEVWSSATSTIESKILGPHLEALATEWVAQHAHREAGLDAGVTGQATVSCPEHKTSHEIDVLSFRRGRRPTASHAAIAFIGEAKCRDRNPGVAELHRLEHIRDLLVARGHEVSSATLGLFSSTGFTKDLITAAARSRGKVLLVDLDQLYGTRPL